MYEITVEATFNATHAILIKGEREPIHGHDWRVVVTLEGAELDTEGLLCDFHEVESVLDQIITPWRHAHLNDLVAFQGLEPTAERVSETLARSLSKGLQGRLPDTARVARVAVTEAPGCVATYLP